jgi:hypothetical protein
VVGCAKALIGLAVWVKHGDLPSRLPRAAGQRRALLPQAAVNYAAALCGARLQARCCAPCAKKGCTEGRALCVARGWLKWAAGPQRRWGEPPPCPESASGRQGQAMNGPAACAAAAGCGWGPGRRGRGACGWEGRTGPAGGDATPCALPRGALAAPLGHHVEGGKLRCFRMQESPRRP